MFIQTERTPNPATIRFLPGQTVVADGTANFTTKDAAKQRSPLATRIFAVDGVTGVFLGADFITVTREADAEWEILQPMVTAAIMDHFQSGEVVLKDSAGTTDAQDDDAVVSKIKELLDTRIRPAVAMDGGDIVFSSFEDGIVYLHMQGACAGCPSATMTLKSGVENLLRHYIPEVIEVRQIEE